MVLMFLGAKLVQGCCKKNIVDFLVVQPDLKTFKPTMLVETGA